MTEEPTATSSAEGFNPSLSSPPREGIATNRRIRYLAASAAALSAIQGTTSVAPVDQTIRYVGGGLTSGARMLIQEEGHAKDTYPDGDDDDILGEEFVAVQMAIIDQMSMVRSIHDASGLTWAQIGKIIGVSRRAVHLWANGARMNASNAEALNELASIIRRLPQGTPDQRRAALLAPDRDGMSIVDKFRTRHGAASENISGSPFGPHQLLGAVHDDATQ